MAPRISKKKSTYFDDEPLQPDQPLIPKIVRMQKTSSSDEENAKEKTTRKASMYNIKIGEFMKQIHLEENQKPKEERCPRQDRMRKAQEMYRTWKSMQS